MDNLSSISYEDGWKNASNPVRYEKSTDKQDNQVQKEVKKKPTGRPLLTIIQIVLCFLIVLAAYIIKLFGNDLYKNVKSFYQTQLNNEIIMNPYENDLNNLFNAAKD